MRGALKLGTRVFDWADGRISSLTGGLDGLQVDAGQGVVRGLQSLEAGS